MTWQFENLLSPAPIQAHSVASRVVSAVMGPLFCTVLLVLSAPATAQQFPQFQNQMSATSGTHSSIVTSDRVNFWDSSVAPRQHSFATLVNNTPG
jgi:hypothetical protein